MQRTLVLIKPDAVGRGLTGVILDRFERVGLRLDRCHMVRASLELLQAHYADLRQRQPAAFDRTVNDLQGQCFLAVELVGHRAVAKARSLVGATDPIAAAAGTIRGDYGLDTIEQADAEGRATRNLVHASDAVASAERELELWLGNTGDGSGRAASK